MIFFCISFIPDVIRSTALKIVILIMLAHRYLSKCMAIICESEVGVCVLLDKSGFGSRTLPLQIQFLLSLLLLCVEY